VDVGSSFGASKILEDNLLAQLVANQRRVRFVGDDTWMDLFDKETFTPESQEYPSLNVKDLHTVDLGVEKHMLEALQCPDQWDVLIGHGLGVDHAGHIHSVGYIHHHPTAIY
jgi:phosphatidylinositol glycan class O